VVAAIAAATVGVVFGRLSPVRPAAAPGMPTESPTPPRIVVTRAATVPRPRVVPTAPRPRAVPGASHRARPVPPAGSAVPVSSAAATATKNGLRAGIAVLDIRTGRFYGAGAVDAPFGTASVVKVLIAADLLANHEMTGRTADLAYSMITRSDDDAANILWIRVGGPALEPWIAKHYGISGLGSPNSIPGRWGNTHVTPRGLVLLYAKLRADPAVWPWLGRAMHHAARIAKDGTDQFFGLPAVDPGAAIKQGWASGSADSPADAVINTTGYLDHDRYAVAILTEGMDNNGTTDSRGFNGAQAAVVTAMAKQLGRI
jgi:hypothetical protein